MPRALSELVDLLFVSLSAPALFVYSLSAFYALSMHSVHSLFAFCSLMTLITLSLFAFFRSLTLPQHASAAEFSRHAKAHRPLTFVLSEEDGKVRSIIDGEMRKIECDDISKLICQHHYSKRMRSHRMSATPSALQVSPSCIPEIKEESSERVSISEGNAKGTTQRRHNEANDDDDDGIEIILDEPVEIV